MQLGCPLNPYDARSGIKKTIKVHRGHSAHYAPKVNINFGEKASGLA
jgi:hypothetical protein